MSFSKSKFSILMVLPIMAFFCGCATTSSDQLAQDAKAQSGALAATEVEVLSIPYDANYPTYVIVVEDFGYNASGTVSGGDPVSQWLSANRGNIGPGLSAQLITALTRSGNVQVLEAEGLQRNADGSYKTKLGENELGPFIIRGTVTEFNETAQADKKKKGIGLGALGAVAGIAGAVTGKDGLMWSGAGVAAANPKFKKEKMKRSGAVGMDLRIVDGSNNRLIGALNCNGSFTTVSEDSGFSLFGISKSDGSYAASALGQATRAAMNDAVAETTSLLKNKAH